MMWGLGSPFNPSEGARSARSSGSLRRRRPPSDVGVRFRDTKSDGSRSDVAGSAVSGESGGAWGLQRPEFGYVPDVASSASDVTSNTNTTSPGGSLHGSLPNSRPGSRVSLLPSVAEDFNCAKETRPTESTYDQCPDERSPDVSEEESSESSEDCDSPRSSPGTALVNPRIRVGPQSRPDVVSFAELAEVTDGLSIGSRLHKHGTCTPCHYYYRGPRANGRCHHDKMCEFCHSDDHRPRKQAPLVSTEWF